MYVLIGEKSLYETTLSQSMCVQMLSFSHYSDICRIIYIPEDHFKIQDSGQVSGQVSCRYPLHMNPYIV